MTGRFDTVVVGGGVAGSVAAVLLARAGQRVLLLEQRRRDRLGEKVCGCCLHRRGVAALERLGLMPTPGETGRAELGIQSLQRVWLSRLSVARSVHRRVSLPLRHGVALRRSVLDGHLLDAAEAAGVEIRSGVRARRRGDRVGVGDQTLEAAHVVWATGLAGARPVGPSGGGVSHRLHGVGTILPDAATPHTPAFLRGTVWLMGEASEQRGGAAREDGGYLGLVRLPGGGVDAAAAVPAQRARDPTAWAARLLHAAGATELAAAAGTIRWRSVGPLRRCSRPDLPAGWVAAGDAAGYAEPLTGEGMAWAVASAERAAAVVLGGGGGACWRAAWSRRRCHWVSAAARRLPALAGRRVQTPHRSGGGARCAS